MPLGMDVGLSSGDFVLDGELGTQLPLAKRGQSPQFSAHVHYGQTAGWIKMALGMDVSLGLDPGHIVLDGDPAPQKNGAQPPNFWLMSTVS